MDRLKSILQNHGVIAYPTETVYGLGCDPFNLKALNKVNNIKRRSGAEGFLVLIDNPYQVYRYAARVPKYAERLMLEFWPGAVTLVFSAREDIPSELTGSRQTIGIRLSSHEIARSVAKILPHGIVSTSANISGEAPLTSYDDVKAKFSDQVDYIVPGECGSKIPSTVVECLGDVPRIVREGSVRIDVKRFEILETQP